jgi:cysteinyl-tRNA synthetase
MARVGVLAPTHAPLATDYIGHMVDFIQRLIDGGHAYESNGDVYYKVSSFADYGKLSGRNTDDLLAGARVDVNEQKTNPLDFALWKAAKPGEPFWSAPWGDGRPGWHIECSVMSEAILGVPLDIHGGGQDLIFPHHENEIAQSEAACSCNFAKLWMHNGFVNINEEKMSKSLGNFFTIRDILKVADGEVLRFFLLTTHYRQPLEYADVKLFDAENSLSRIYIYKDELNHAVPSAKGADLNAEVDAMKDSFYKAFRAAIEDDFNTPAALAAVFDMVRAGNTILTRKITSESLEHLRQVSADIFKDIDAVLAVCGRKADDWFRINLTMPESEVLAMIEDRNAARKEKNFARADEIRKALSDKGVELVDTAVGTRYRAVRKRILGE